MALKTRWRRLLTALLILLVAGLLFVVVVVVDGWVAFGKAATGARAAQMRLSPQWQDDHFANPQPMWNDMSLKALFQPSPVMTPTHPPATVVLDKALFLAPPSSGLRVTWLGHSTLLIEIDGLRFLTDPIFGERASPVSWVGPQRWYPPPLALEDLPPVDAVIISHDHYDHLQYDTVARITSWHTTFLAPLGVGAHLEYWGVPPERVVELDWWQQHRIGDVDLHCTPARHASGRHVLDQNETLWAGWAFVGPVHRAFFSGDTGLFPAMKDIGDRLGPFDITMIENGAYSPQWPDWHIGPEQAVKAHTMLRGKVLLPVHWGLWALASHGWTEPAERVLVAAQKQGVIVTIPRPGQSIEPSSLPPQERWWPALPWATAEEQPIVSTANGDPAHRMP